jgi:hypothetical protein
MVMFVFSLIYVWIDTGLANILMKYMHFGERFDSWSMSQK